MNFSEEQKEKILLALKEKNDTTIEKDRLVVSDWGIEWEDKDTTQEGDYYYVKWWWSFREEDEEDEEELEELIARFDLELRLLNEYYEYPEEDEETEEETEAEAEEKKRYIAGLRWFI